MEIRSINFNDKDIWIKLRTYLWPNHNHKEEIEKYFKGLLKEPVEVFVVEDDKKNIIAFIELSIRYNITGYIGKKIGYIEGIYILPHYRGGNIARKLLFHSKKWAYQNNCEYFATDRSDRLIFDNTYKKEM